MPIFPSSYLLYAEDDPDDQEMLKEIMSGVDRNLRVVCCSHGLELMQFLSDLPVDEPYPCCIILDLNMPLWDGMRTLEELKKYPDTLSVPVVLFTTSDQQRDQQRALKLGAQAFVTKPARWEEFDAVGRQLAKFVQNPPLIKKGAAATATKI